MPQSVDRALDVLDAVAESAEPVTAKALARRLGCGLSTVYDLLGSLTERGHLVRAGGGYALGHRIPALHQAFQRQLRVDDGIQELLLRVRGATGADAHLSAYRDGEISIVGSTAAPAHSPFSLGRETRAHATAHGKTLLSALPPAARRRYLDRAGMPRLTESTITSAEHLDRELRRVRRTGVAVEIEESVPGFACLSVPVRLGGAAAPGAVTALSASVPLEMFLDGRERLAEILRSAAREAAGPA
ncbi:IclR family transcriptional regulator [Streptomyces sp. URMC 123]|uniref:IclR family transcriptional regulator n=1 Tax=Streptomyces sp. URMC 123 TaxID=3423403 RepID=UPI003F1DF6C2